MSAWTYDTSSQTGFGAWGCFAFGEDTKDIITTDLEKLLVAQVLLTLPFSFSQLSLLSGVLFQLFYGLLEIKFIPFSLVTKLISIHSWASSVNAKQFKLKFGKKFKGHPSHLRESTIGVKRSLDNLKDVKPWFHELGMTINDTRKSKGSPQKIPHALTGLGEFCASLMCLEMIGAKVMTGIGLGEFCASLTCLEMIGAEVMTG
ncbi:hypothetical protein Sjap_011295 [Stephania japonica]|uniref:Uncharacterized protein n=1 Tax=Stephania japonica TaxID=461633 RepID=A0AAP0P4X5_9MAGN